MECTKSPHEPTFGWSFQQTSRKFFHPSFFLRVRLLRVCNFRFFCIDYSRNRSFSRLKSTGTDSRRKSNRFDSSIFSKKSPTLHQKSIISHTFKWCQISRIATAFIFHYPSQQSLVWVLISDIRIWRRSRLESCRSNSRIELEDGLMEDLMDDLCSPRSVLMFALQRK